MLNMIRTEVNVRDFQRWMGTRRLQDPDHAMHCLLAECFGEAAPKSFRAIFPRRGSGAVLYGYGQADAGALREAANTYADPLQSKILPAGSLDSKLMPAEWPREKRMGFEVRIRPIIRRSQNAACRPGKEQDAFQAEADNHPKGEMPRTREEVYRDWLSGQFAAKGGAGLESAALQSFQRTRAFRRRHTRYSEGPDAVMRGILKVIDPDAFAELLARGVGRHRAYGYGMLLLRPAGKDGNA